MKKPLGLLTILPLNSSHVVNSFYCGETELDYWIWFYDLKSSLPNESPVYVLIARANPTIVLGWYTLALASFESMTLDVASKAQTLLGNDPNLIEITYIAVDEAFQKAGLGSLLLADAIKRAQATSNAIYIHALYPRNAKLYRKLGFNPLSGHPHDLILNLRPVTN
jgi:ribosomal protein S18 acetylase RimI-like enzyme